MDSIKTKAKNYVEAEGDKCIGQVMAVAEPGGFRVYVAWEWKDMASKGMFGFCKSRNLYPLISWDNIITTADQGFDIGGTGEEKKIFKNLF
jgi:hypothetical protein